MMLPIKRFRARDNVSKRQKVQFTLPKQIGATFFEIVQGRAGQLLNIAEIELSASQTMGRPIL